MNPDDSVTQTDFESAYRNYLEPSPQPGTWGQLIGICATSGDKIPFSVIRLLGRGGMGAVFLAVDESRRRPVALKLPRADRLSTFQVSAFHVEEEATKTVSQGSRWIIEWLSHGLIHPVGGAVTRQLPFLALEYVAGRSLHKKLLDWGDGTIPGRLPQVEVGRVAIEICRGLEDIHGATPRYVHRDLKPANILFDTLSGGQSRIADFGVAVSTTPAGSTQWGGTLDYVPPECFPEPFWNCITSGLKVPCSPQFDLYSLGCMIYEMLVGHLPFRHRIARQRFRDGDNALEAAERKEWEYFQRHAAEMPHRLVGDVELGLSNLVMRLLEKDPINRLPNATDVRIELESLLPRIHSHPTSTVSTWPALDAKLLPEIRDMASNHFRFPLEWGVDKSGIVLGLAKRSQLSLELDEWLQEFLNLVDRWGDAVDGHIESPSVAKRPLEDPLFKDVQTFFHEGRVTLIRIKSNVTTFRMFKNLLEQCQNLLTETHDTFRIHWTAGDLPALQKFLAEVRSRLFELQIDGVERFAMASDRLLVAIEEIERSPR